MQKVWLVFVWESDIADYLHHSHDGFKRTTTIREATWPDNDGNLRVTGKTNSEQY